MAVSAAVVTGFLPTANSSYTDFTSSGFGTPTAAIVLVSAASSGNNPYALAQAGIGFWTSGSQCGAGVSSDDAVTTSNAGNGVNNSNCVAIPVSVGNAWQITASASTSGVSDGLRITKNSGTTSVQRFAIVILLKGTTNAYAGTDKLPSTGSSTSVTSPGFKPDMLFGALTAGASANAYDVHARISMGVAHNSSSDTITQGVVAFGDLDNQSVAQIVNTVIHSSRWLQQAINDSITTYAAVSSFDTNGYTLSYASNSFARQYCYLALEFPDPDDGYVGIIDSKTSPGTQGYTGTGFTPVVVGLFGTTLTSVDTLATSAVGSITMGAASGTSADNCVVFGSQDNVGDSNTYSRYDDAAILNLRDHADSVDAVAALSSFDTNGFTLDYSDGSSSARKILAWAIGDSAGGGGATLTVQDLTQGHILGVPSLTEHNVLAANALSQAQSLEAPSLTQHNLLSVDALAHSHALGEPSLAQAHVLIVQAIGQDQSLGEPALTQHNVLVVDALGQSQVLEAPSLTAAGSLAVDALAQAQSLGLPALVQHHVLAVDALAQTQAFGSPSLTQAHILTPDALNQAQTTGNVSFTIAASLAVQAIAQAQAFGSPDLTQHHVLTPDAIVQAQQLAEAALTQHGALSVDGMTQGQTLDALALTQHNAIIVQSLLQGHELGTSSLTANDVLTVAGITQAQLLEIPGLTQHAVLAVDGLTQAQILGLVGIGGAIIGIDGGTIVCFQRLGGRIVASRLGPSIVAATLH